MIGVEIVEEAVTAAKENAEANGLTNCSFLAGDVLKVIDEIEEKPDFIVLDPPREGIHPKALPKIVDLYRCEKNALHLLQADFSCAGSGRVCKIWIPCRKSLLC